MKKRMISIILIAAMVLPAAACGTKNSSAGADFTVQEDAQESAAEPQEETSEPEAVSPEQKLMQISEDFAAVIQKIEDEKDALFEETASYEDYVENRQKVTDWYQMTISESEGLLDRTRERAKEYFQLVADTIDHEDYDAIDDALDDFYDDIYDDALDDFYDEIYDDAMDDMYDQYYDGIVEDAYDTIPYEEWNDALADCYREWSDSSTSIYRLWSDAGTDLYRMWSDISSGFYKGDFDVDALLSKQASEPQGSSDESTDEQKEAEVSVAEADTDDVSDASESDGMDPAFKEAMDSYEAFFDEYVEFMKKYEDASDDELVAMMADYYSYMSRYIEAMDKLEAIDEDELTTEELQYYLDVTARINKKLAEIM